MTERGTWVFRYGRGHIRHWHPYCGMCISQRSETMPVLSIIPERVFMIWPKPGAVGLCEDAGYFLKNKEHGLGDRGQATLSSRSFPWLGTSGCHLEVVSQIIQNYTPDSVPSPQCLAAVPHWARGLRGSFCAHGGAP